MAPSPLVGSLSATPSRKRVARRVRLLEKAPSVCRTMRRTTDIDEAKDPPAYSFRWRYCAAFTLPAMLGSMASPVRVKASGWRPDAASRSPILTQLPPFCLPHRLPVLQLIPPR